MTYWQNQAKLTTREQLKNWQFDLQQSTSCLTVTIDQNAPLTFHVQVFIANNILAQYN